MGTLERRTSPGERLDRQALRVLIADNERIHESAYAGCLRKKRTLRSHANAAMADRS